MADNEYIRQYSQSPNTDELTIWYKMKFGIFTYNNSYRNRDIHRHTDKETYRQTNKHTDRLMDKAFQIILHTRFNDNKDG